MKAPLSAASSKASVPRKAPEVDLSRRFVRVTGTRPGGFVEFQFAVGDPATFVELILPVDVFEDFCASHEVTRLDPGEPDGEGGDDFNWNLHDATHRRFRGESGLSPT